MKLSNGKEVSARRYREQDAEAIVNESALIVRVKKTDEAPVTYSLEGGLQDCFTLSAVEVVEIFKDSGNLSIAEGSGLNI